MYLYKANQDVMSSNGQFVDFFDKSLKEWCNIYVSLLNTLNL